MDIVERLRDWNKFGVSRGDFVAYSHEAADEIAQLRNAIKVQANAVRVLHKAEMSELNHLRKNAQEAHTAKATLDSEREANKILTDEIERLREQCDRMASLAIDNAKDTERAMRLQEALREIYEVYAGSEGIPQPMTAAEGYLLSLLMEVVRIAQKALKEKV